MMGISKSFLGTMGAIVATGALLNMAGSGLFGAQVKDLAKYVTSGYGA